MATESLNCTTCSNSSRAGFANTTTRQLLPLPPAIRCFSKRDATVTVALGILGAATALFGKLSAYHLFGIPLLSCILFVCAPHAARFFPHERLSLSETEECVSAVSPSKWFYGRVAVILTLLLYFEFFAVSPYASAHKKVLSRRYYGVHSAHLKLLEEIELSNQQALVISHRSVRAGMSWIGNRDGKEGWKEPWIRTMFRLGDLPERELDDQARRRQKALPMADGLTTHGFDEHQMRQHKIQQTWLSILPSLRPKENTVARGGTRKSPFSFFGRADHVGVIDEKVILSRFEYVLQSLSLVSHSSLESSDAVDSGEDNSFWSYDISSDDAEAEEREGVGSESRSASTEDESANEGESDDDDSSANTSHHSASLPHPYAFFPWLNRQRVLQLLSPSIYSFLVTAFCAHLLYSTQTNSPVLVVAAAVAQLARAPISFSLLSQVWSILSSMVSLYRTEDRQLWVASGLHPADYAILEAVEEMVGANAETSTEETAGGQNGCQSLWEQNEKSSWLFSAWWPNRRTCATQWSLPSGTSVDLPQEPESQEAESLTQQTKQPENPAIEGSPREKTASGKPVLVEGPEGYKNDAGTSRSLLALEAADKLSVATSVWKLFTLSLFGDGQEEQTTLLYQSKTDAVRGTESEEGGDAEGHFGPSTSLREVTPMRSLVLLARERKTAAYNAQEGRILLIRADRALRAGVLEHAFVALVASLLLLAWLARAIKLAFLFKAVCTKRFTGRFARRIRERQRNRDLDEERRRMKRAVEITPAAS